MSDDIHDLLREIDKALEQVRAVGAIDADLSLKLPRAAQPAFEALCVVRDPLHRPGSRYQGIPITEWTDGPFMSFSLDHKVIFDHTMPDTFYGKGVSGAVERIMPATGGLVRGWDFGLVGERPNPFPAGVFMREPLTAEVCCDAAAPCEKHARITTDVDTVTIKLEFEGGLEREWKPGDSPVLPDPEFYGRGFLVTGSSAWMGTDGVKREAPEFARIGTKTVEHNFSTAHDKTIDMVRALWRKQMAYQWGGKYWRITSIVERNPGEADVRSIEVHRPATFFDLQAWLVGEITSIPIELDCPALPIALIPEGMWADAARPSTISKLLTRRRKLIAKAKRASPDDAAVGSAILAMSGKGRANEL